MLSVGIAVTGLVTFLFFSFASHALGKVDYKGISLLWSVMWLIISVIYRPVEQLLSRTIAQRRAVGLGAGGQLRGPAATIASTHGGVRPWCAHGSSETYMVAPSVSASPHMARAATSACGPP